MSATNNLSVEQKLIKQLNEEKDELKEKLVALNLEFEIYKKEQADGSAKAKTLIEQCSVAEQQYWDSIKEAEQAKNEYNEACKEIYKLKAQYLSAMENMLKRLS